MKIDAHIHLTNPAEYAAGSSPEFFCSERKSPVEKWHHIGVIEIDVPKPSEFVGEALELIEKDEYKLRGAFQAKLDELSDTRAKLLAIEHAGGVA